MADVIVTGASGFIGRHLVGELHGAAHNVIEVTRERGDISDDATWATLPRADVVVHLAARSFVPNSWTQPTPFFQTNVLGTVAALGYCRAQGARLIVASSYMYGHPERLPISETAPVSASNPYALSKKMAEEACAFFAERFDVPVTILRLFNAYGPGQPIEFLIPSIIEQIRGGREIHVRDLAPKRDLVYVRDVVGAMMKALDCARGLNVFNIGSGTSHSVTEIIETIQSVWGIALPVRSDEVRRDNEIMDTIADISRASTQLGWQPKFSLRQGIEDIKAQSA